VKRSLFIILMVLALAGVVAASILRNDGGKQKGVKVYAEEVTRRDVTQVVKASGQVDPRVKVELSAHVVARIERLYVEEGDDVVAGEPVVELEREAFEAAWERANAQHKIALSQVRQAEIDLKNADLKRRRYLRLAEEGIESRERLEMAQLEYDSAALRLEQAQEEVRRTLADVEKARDDLEKVIIYAPVSGRVIELNAEAGEVVVSGTMNNPASVIATIADLSEILVEVEVDETEIVYLRPGQRARVVVDALPEEVYHGRVVEIGSSGTKDPRQGDVTFFKVKLLLDEPGERLRPGMSARAEIEVATHRDTLVVPIQAVVYRPPVDAGVEAGPEAAAEEADEVQVVFAVVDGRAEQRPVEVGIADATHIEILAGVDEGTLVVTGPYRTLRDLEHGDAVRVDRPRAAEKDGEGNDG